MEMAAECHPWQTATEGFRARSSSDNQCLCSAQRNRLLEHAVKKRFLPAILAVAAQLFAADRIGITVSSYTLNSDVFVIHATAAGRPIDLLCNQASPFCTVPKPGEYWMVDWTVPVIEYRGDYVCREVNLYRRAATPEKARKLGEYCLVEK